MKTTLTLALAFAAAMATAQDVTYQDEAIKSFPMGEYTAYNAQQSEDGSYLGGWSSVVWKLVEVVPSESQPGRQTNLIAVAGKTKYDVENKRDEVNSTFMPDHLEWHSQRL